MFSCRPKLPPVTLGSAKQLMANPMLGELRLHRATLQALLKQLRVVATEAEPLAPVVRLTRWQQEHRR